MCFCKTLLCGSVYCYISSCNILSLLLNSLKRVTFSVYHQNRTSSGPHPFLTLYLLPLTPSSGLARYNMKDFTSVITTFEIFSPSRLVFIKLGCLHDKGSITSFFCSHYVFSVMGSSDFMLLVVSVHLPVGGLPTFRFAFFL